MAKIPLPQGAWAQFQDVEDITNRQRKDFFRRTRNLPEGWEDVDTADLAVIAFIQAWSYPHPLPTLENNTLDELPAKAVDQMYLAVRALLKAITPDFEPNPDPASPTGPSTA